MFKLILILLSTGFIASGYSQRVVPSGQLNGVSPIGMQSANQTNILGTPSFEGQRFRIKADDAIEGDPLLFEDWKSGEVTLKNNEKYRVEKINLDALGNKFVYSKNDTLYEFFDNVKEIKIYSEDHLTNPAADMVFRAGFSPISSDFVQVLTSGKIDIFRKFVKKPEGENYSNGIVNHARKYTLHSTQYAVVDKIVTPIKFDSETLGQLTSDKKSQVDAYIKENKLKAKKEKDFLMAINYYNSISIHAN